MKFEEVGCRKIRKPELVCIYFLVKNGDVVYVGKTKQGTSRIAQHKDKEFDVAYMLPCNESELDEIEDRYIKKYKPKYNKQANYAMNVSLQRVRDMARQADTEQYITVNDVKRSIRSLGIATYMIDMKAYVSRDDASMIVAHITSGE